MRSDRFTALLDWDRAVATWREVWRLRNAGTWEGPVIDAAVTAMDTACSSLWVHRFETGPAGAAIGY